MKKMFAALALAAALPVAAADAAPQPSARQKDLRCMVGSWQGKGTMVLEGKSNDVQATYDCKAAAGGFGVTCNLRMTGVPGVPEYLLTDVWGYDDASGKVHWYVVTNAGEVHDHHGTLDDVKAAVAYEGTVEGKKFLEKVVFVFDTDKKFQLTASSTLGEKAVEQTTMTFTKR
jgi:hypothetical protein